MAGIAIPAPLVSLGLFFLMNAIHGLSNERRFREYPGGYRAMAKSEKYSIGLKR
jgi:hypothetical protein